MLDTFKNWIAKPFATDMNAGQWFLFFGLLVAIAAGWHMILRAIDE